MSHKPAGFTLLELLVVLAIIASASAAVVLSLRDSPQSRLQAEAERVIAVLEASRADARASNTAMRWHADDQGFQVHTLPTTGPAVHNMAWLHKGTQASPVDVLISAEPVQARSRLTLSHDSGASLSIGTDGAAAFKVLP
jgi:general secretion pathway protein H